MGGYAFAVIYQERVSVDQSSDREIRPDELTSVLILTEYVHVLFHG